MNGDAPLTGPGTLEAIAPLRLPKPARVFARRAERFLALAPGNTLGEYLQLLGRLAQAQVAALERMPFDSAARRSGGTEGALALPLDAMNHRRDPVWHDLLARIVQTMGQGDLPAETRAALELLAILPPPELEALADRVLANAVVGSDLAAGPFVAAALQVYFTALAARLDAAAIAPRRDACPVCGSQPVTGIILGDDKVRYLVCSLCASEWHRTRVECTVCEKGANVTYYTVEGDAAAKEPLSRGAARAEACSACKVYTKLFYTEKDPALEPFADDIATLPLDLLMAENGWERHGVNLFLLPGEVRAPLAN
ncbi:MAG: formate dehydrogenase accessory protein FdhE [Anaeromyxobacteraceae bacterium]